MARYTRQPGCMNGRQIVAPLTPADGVTHLSPAEYHSLLRKALRNGADGYNRRKSREDSERFLAECRERAIAKLHLKGSPFPEDRVNQ